MEIRTGGARVADRWKDFGGACFGCCGIIEALVDEVCCTFVVGDKGCVNAVLRDGRWDLVRLADFGRVKVTWTFLVIGAADCGRFGLILACGAFKHCKDVAGRCFS